MSSFNIELPLLHDDALEPQESRSVRRQQETTAVFSCSRQLHDLLIQGSTRFLGTAAFMTCILASLRIYEIQGNMSSAQKTTLDSLEVAVENPLYIDE